MKPRQNIYLDEDLCGALNKLAKKPGSSKSAIINDALKSYLERRGAKELDDKLKPRLDKLSGSLNRVERNQLLLAETLGTFIRFYFSVVPPLPEADQAAARALAHERFQAFIDQVGRRLAGGHGVMDDLVVRSAEAGP